MFDNEKVRRQDRLLDEQSAMRLLQDGEYGVLSLVEDRDNVPAGYGIPLNYAWDGGRFIYFHCAPLGRKLECADANPAASFCVVGHTQIVSNQFTTAYESIVLRGTLSRGLSVPERMEALTLLIDKYSPEDKELGLKYAEKSFHRTEILRFEIKSLSGKTKQVRR